MRLVLLHVRSQQLDLCPLLQTLSLHLRQYEQILITICIFQERVYIGEFLHLSFIQYVSLQFLELGFQGGAA